MQVAEILKDRLSWYRDCRCLNVLSVIPTGNGGTVELIYMQVGYTIYSVSSYDYFFILLFLIPFVFLLDLCSNDISSSTWLLDYEIYNKFRRWQSSGIFVDRIFSFFYNSYIYLVKEDILFCVFIREIQSFGTICGFRQPFLRHCITLWEQRQNESWCIFSFGMSCRFVRGHYLLQVVVQQGLRHLLL